MARVMAAAPVLGFEPEAFIVSEELEEKSNPKTDVTDILDEDDPAQAANTQ